MLLAYLLTIHNIDIFIIIYHVYVIIYVNLMKTNLQGNFNSIFTGNMHTE